MTLLFLESYLFWKFVIIGFVFFFLIKCCRKFRWKPAEFPKELHVYKEELNLFRHSRQGNIYESRLFNLVWTVIDIGTKKGSDYR